MVVGRSLQDWNWGHGPVDRVLAGVAGVTGVMAQRVKCLLGKQENLIAALQAPTQNLDVVVGNQP